MNIELHGFFKDAGIFYESLKGEIHIGIDPVFIRGYLHPTAVFRVNYFVTA